MYLHSSPCTYTWGNTSECSNTRKTIACMHDKHRGTQIQLYILMHRTLYNHTPSLIKPSLQTSLFLIKTPLFIMRKLHVLLVYWGINKGHALCMESLVTHMVQCLISHKTFTWETQQPLHPLSSHTPFIHHQCHSPIPSLGILQWCAYANKGKIYSNVII